MDWEAVKDRIMHEAVLTKLTQHAENDRYRGDDGDGSGKNRLGQILMRVRDALRGQ